MIGIELISNILGWIGMFIILLAYYLLSVKKMTAKNISYHLLNFLGAAGLIINTIINKAWPATALEVVWALIAIVAIIAITVKRNKKSKNKNQKKKK